MKFRNFFRNWIKRTAVYKELSDKTEVLQKRNDELAHKNKRLEARFIEEGEKYGELAEQHTKYYQETEERINSLSREKDGLSARVNELNVELEESKARYVELEAEKERAVVELGLTRVGKGEKPSDLFDYRSKIVNEMARRYKQNREELNRIFDERNELKRALCHRISSYYLLIIDSLEKTGKLGGKFGVLYIDNECNVARVSQGVEKILELSAEQIVGNKYSALLRVIERKSRRELILSWRKDNEEYIRVYLKNGKKLYVSLNKVSDPYDYSTTGTFVYLSRHRLFHMKNRENYVGVIKTAQADLEQKFREQTKLPEPDLGMT